MYSAFILYLYNISISVCIYCVLCVHYYYCIPIYKPHTAHASRPPTGSIRFIIFLYSSARPSRVSIVYIPKRIKTTNLFIRVGFIFREDYNIIIHDNNNERATDNRLVTPGIEIPESTRENLNVNYNILSYNNSIEGTSTSHVFYFFFSSLTTTTRFGPPPPPPTTTTKLERVSSYRHNIIIILYGIPTYLLKFNFFYSSPSKPNTWLHFFFMYSYT